MSSDHDPEAVRRERLHRLRTWSAHGPSGGPEDPIVAIRIRLHDSPPRVVQFRLCRWSLAARLVQDSQGSGDTVQILGPEALPMLTQAAQRGQFAMGEMVLVGVARGGKWLRWYPPAPPEPVPGSPGEHGQRN